MVASRGEGWYNESFIPRSGLTALLGLLYTIVLMFVTQGTRILQFPAGVLRIAIPLVGNFLHSVWARLRALEEAWLQLSRNGVAVIFGVAPCTAVPFVATATNARSSAFTIDATEGDPERPPRPPRASSA